MARIHGITVSLYTRVQKGSDPFGAPIVEEGKEDVPNVLVSPVSAEDKIAELNLSTERVVYWLGIPKSDTHDWSDAEVEFFGQRFHTVGEPLYGIEDMMPLQWKGKVMVEKIG